MKNRIITLSISIIVLLVLLNQFVPFFSNELFVPSQLSETKWWHYITESLVHYSLIHGVFNLIFFIIVGYYNEPVWGSRRFLLICLVSACAGAISSRWAYSEITVGLSDVIAGICGAVIARGYWYRYSPEARKWGIYYLKIVLTSIIFSFALNVSLGGLVADIAHIAGVLTGALIATFLIFIERRTLAKNEVF